MTWAALGYGAIIGAAAVLTWHALHWIERKVKR